jgi:hypothetical protein
VFIITLTTTCHDIPILMAALYAALRCVMDFAGRFDYRHHRSSVRCNWRWCCNCTRGFLGIWLAAFGQPSPPFNHRLLRDYRIRREEILHEDRPFIPAFAARNLCS